MILLDVCIGGRIDVVQELESNQLGVRELAEREAKSVEHELILNGKVFCS